VAICGRTEAKLAQAAEAIRRAGAKEALYAVADVRDPEQCRAAVGKIGEKFGRIDVFVNNAAGNFMSLAEDVSPKAFSTVIDIDLRGTFHMASAALPWLRAAGASGKGATMIQVSATLHYKAAPFQGPAAAAKAGIDSLTRTLASEWADDGIRVVAIAPGPIADTEGGPTGRVFGEASKNADIRALVPLGRYGDTRDIANAAVFLASPGGSLISGEVLVVDGLQWQATGASGMLSVKDRLRAAMKQQKESRQRGSGSKGHEGDAQARL
jgi:peroxisomal 2,4-dienoyl-CoA reductase